MKYRRYIILALLIVLLALLVWLFTRRREEIYSYLPQSIASPMIAKDTEERILTLHPIMQPYVRALVQRAKDELGMELIIPSTGAYRSIDEQNALYAKGRTAPGDIVTKVKGGNSWHNYGLAVDVVEVKPFYGYKAGYDKNRWIEIGELGKSLGLVWGGDFNNDGNYTNDSFVDRPHFELPVNKTRTQLLAEVNATGNPYPNVMAV